MELVRHRTLEEMEGDPTVEVGVWFGVFAEDLGAVQSALAGELGKEFFEVHGRKRMGQLFKMVRSRALETVEGKGGDEGFLQTIEDLSGFEFRGLSVPSSAALVTEGESSSCRRRPSRQRARRETGSGSKGPTISEELRKDGAMVDEVLGPEIFADVETEDVKNRAITEDELEGISDKVLAKYAKSHGRLNMGKPLCRHLGRLFKAECPLLPTYGDKKGTDRKHWKILYDKSQNRQYVACPHT